jgi:hypothetical protein
MGLVDLTLRGQLRTVVCEEYSEKLAGSAALTLYHQACGRF